MKLGMVKELETKLRAKNFTWADNLKKAQIPWHIAHKFLIMISIVTALSLSVNSIGSALKDAERKVENRNILIADLQKKNEELSNENLAVHEENKDLRFENDEQKELIDRITKIATANSYNNEKAILGKIKELISDYQSQN